MIDALLQGFSVAFQPENLLFIFIGVLVGQIVGALPGVGPAAGMALLLPLTFGLEPVTAIMMLAGIMYGGQYGGTWDTFDNHAASRTSSKINLNNLISSKTIHS